MPTSGSHTKKVLLAGYGDLAQRVAPHLVDSECRVLGVARSEKPAIKGVDQWRGSIAELVVESPPRSDHPEGSFTEGAREAFVCDVAIITLTPGGRREQDYVESYLNNVRLLVNAWKRCAQRPELVLFVSSTSVYGQDSGEWVNEESETTPSSDTAQILLETEKLLLSSGIKSCVVRFSGIYGPGRNFLLKQVYNGDLGSGAYTNRIHADDCAGVLAFLVKCHWKGQAIPELLLASDSKPVSSSAAREWLAKAMEEKDPGLNLLSNISPVKPSNRVRGMNKRCDNSRLIKLGYRFRYPSFKEGFPLLVEDFMASPVSASQADKE